MKNTNYNSKHNKRAFTLIELLIVIAIIGILFIVLVSRVDFATDKAKATGVQTDFRSFQVALDQVAKENAGFNIFGWDTGDVNGDHIRNSYDHGDTNQNGIEDADETFIGRKEYGENWTTIYTMLNPKDGMENDTSAFEALEQAINANLDPKLHITITPDVEGGNLTGNATITMANQARDPWKNEYHGVFITNAVRDDGADRGAIIIYSDGANGKWGSAHDITNGVVSVTVPNNNKNGQDDYSIVSFYTYTNGYGEVLNMTTGFSNNQNFLNGGVGGNILVGDEDVPNVPDVPDVPNEPGNTNISYEMTTGDIVVDRVQPLTFRSTADVSKFKEFRINDQVVSPSYYIVTSGSTIITLDAAYVELLENGIHSVEIVSIDGSAECQLTKEVEALAPGLYDGNDNFIISYDGLVATYGFRVDTDYIEGIGGGLGGGWGGPWVTDNVAKVLNLYYSSYDKLHLVLPDDVTRLGEFSLSEAQNLYKITLGKNFSELAFHAVHLCSQLTQIAVSTDNPYVYTENNCLITKDTQELLLGLSGDIPDGVRVINGEAYMHSYVKHVVIPDSVVKIECEAFAYSSLTNLTMGKGVQIIEGWAFAYTNIKSIYIPASMQVIEDYAFNGCSLLYEVYNASTLDIVAGSDTHGEVAKYAKTVTSGEAISSFETIGDFVFYVENGTYTLVQYNGDGTSIVLPILDNGQKYSIGENVFAGQASLTSLYIPSCVIGIGNSAFRACENLSIVTFSNGIVSLGDEAFAYTALTNVVLPDTLLSIGEQCFSGCDELTSIHLNDGLESIGRYAFFGCNSMQTLYIPSSVTFVGMQIFNWNTTVAIYCGAASKPSNWASGWNHTYTNTLTVYWNSSR